MLMDTHFPGNLLLDMAGGPQPYNRTTPSITIDEDIVNRTIQSFDFYKSSGSDGTEKYRSIISFGFSPV